jgi:D-sedoheptulose 7-phosphate isomerase
MNEMFRKGLQTHIDLAQQLGNQLEILQNITDCLINAIRNRRRIYILGNGGSAADAQHIAAEFVGRFKHDRPALPAMALTTDTSELLSIGNDYGFGHVFTRQVEALVWPGDVLWALSTSGNSSNVIEAVQVAQSRQSIIIGFAGRTGGKLKPLCEHCLCVDETDSARVQEIHQVAYHLICEAVEHHFTQHQAPSPDDENY